MVPVTDLASEHATAPTAIVRSFLESLQDADLDLALSFLDENVTYINVSLPAVRGRDAVERVFRPTIGRMGFRVHFHAVGTDEDDSGIVLTERTDALIFGPVSIQFWVYGRFEVSDGRITVWRDSFDWGDVLKGMIRGVIGLGLPSVRRTWPTDASLARATNS